jgi:predicted nucleotidyltransferase
MISNINLTINQIKEHLTFLSQYEVVVFGSFGSDDFIPNRSDIDIAILSHSEDKLKNSELWYSLLGVAPPVYDIKIFETLPLYIQISIIRNYKVLFGDPLEISEYFYEFRKEYSYMEHRIKENQFKNLAEKQEGIERRKKYQKIRN